MWLLAVEFLRLSKETRDELTSGVVRAFRRYGQTNDELDQAVGNIIGVGRTDMRCLDILHQHGRMTAGELAERAKLSPAAMTSLLDRLEAAGLLRRLRDDTDRRRVLVEITEKMSRTADQLYGPLAAAGAKAMEGLSDRDLRVIRDFISAGAEIQEAQAARLRERLSAEPRP